ncbi:hypothetical protein LVJ94_49985 [Pendulispora rubella]|uniref:Lipoprotein n=1 Tax=Pendulispora rubella TaxID=2741070 RepID=A0ABZ2L2E0_9BACT
MGLCVTSVIVGCDDDDASHGGSTNDGGSDSGLGSDSASLVDGGAPLTMTGSAGGVTLANANAFGVIVATNASGSKTRLRMIFEDREALCATGFMRQNATLLNLDLESPDATLKPGTFPIWDQTHSTPPYADAPFVKLDGSCKPSPDRGAKSGNVVLTAVTDSSVSGTFDITYADGHIQGSFTVPLSCPSYPQTTCVP